MRFIVDLVAFEAKEDAGGLRDGQRKVCWKMAFKLA